jgi:hypothetical protein
MISSFWRFMTNYAPWFWKVCRTQVYMWRRISEKEKTVSAWDWTGVISSGWFDSLTTRPSGLTGPCFTDRFYSNFNRTDHMPTVFNPFCLSIFCIVLSVCRYNLLFKIFTLWVHTSLSQQTGFPIFNCMRIFCVQCKCSLYWQGSSYVRPLYSASKANNSGGGTWQTEKMYLYLFSRFMTFYR